MTTQMKRPTGQGPEGPWAQKFLSLELQGALLPAREWVHQPRSSPSLVVQEFSWSLIYSFPLPSSPGGQWEGLKVTYLPILASFW